jgi:hypothetical protein
MSSTRETLCRTKAARNCSEGKRQRASPPSLATTRSPEILSLWVRLVARTTSDRSLLRRTPANPPRHRAQGTLAEVARRPGAGGRS